MRLLRKTLQEQVYQYLKESIIAGDFALGAQIKEVEVAGRLQVSRTPIHNVMVQLAQDDLLTCIPNKGFFVRSFTEQDIREIIEARIVLENRGIQCLVFGREMNRARLEHIREHMLSAFQQGDHLAYSTMDFTLHKEIVSFSGNSLLIGFNTRINSMVNMLQNISLRYDQNLQTSHEEHLYIIDQLLHRQYEAAWAADYQHLIRTCEDLIAFLAAQSGDVPADDAAKDASASE